MPLLDRWMVYLKIAIGNEAHEDTTFIHIHGGYSVNKNAIQLC